MQPEYEDETAINPFDFWAGANFKLKLKKVAGYWNYDSSEFAAPGALLDDDDALEAIWKKQYSLTALTAADQFKSYDDLDKRLKMVLGAKAPARRFDEELEDESEGRGSFSPNFESSNLLHLQQTSMLLTSLLPSLPTRMKMMLCPTSRNLLRNDEIQPVVFDSFGRRSVYKLTEII